MDERRTESTEGKLRKEENDKGEKEEEGTVVFVRVPFIFGFTLLIPTILDISATISYNENETLLNEKTENQGTVTDDVSLLPLLL